MGTLIFALLMALMFGRGWEGTVRLRPVLASCTFAKLGRVCVAAYAFRRGRVYVRIGVDAGEGGL